MAKVSAGLLMYRIVADDVLFYLVHPGGPYFTKKDTGAWTIPKGEPGVNEILFECAKREFEEETGITASEPFFDLGSIKQAGGKTIYAWAFPFTGMEVPSLISNIFEMEWPPRSGKKQSFPEIDKAQFFTFEESIKKINPAQIPFLERIRQFLNK